MTFVQARNLIVLGLELHLCCPVVLSGQIAEKPTFPYCYYSVLSSRTSNHAFGYIGVRSDEDGYNLQRTEPVSATMSFTFCGQDREGDNANYIFGEDEALNLADKAHGYFLLNAHNIHTDKGDVVISNVGNVVNRSSFLVEDTVRRYGFDIRFNFMRTDEKPTVTITKAGISRS